MTKNDVETFYPRSSEDWRQWLQENHDKKQSIWLQHYKKDSGKASLTWSDAVDVALCFGWIDSTRRSLDNESYIQFFTRRKPNSNWSRINKDKVERLIADGLMNKAGLESIERAKKDGSWDRSNDVEELIVPDDLAKAFRSKKGSEEYFLSLSKSVKKGILHWIVSAKRAETRQKRINEIADHASQNLKPKQF